MVESQLLLDAVAAYSPTIYEARIYPVHLYEWSYDRIPVGDIVELKAETSADGVVSVYAKLRPYSDMVRLNERQQLCYVSLEIDPEFAGTGKAYIKGASLTDAPACLGLDRIQLSDNLSHQQQKLLVTSQQIQLSALAPQHEGVFSRMAHALKQFATEPTPEPELTENPMTEVTKAEFTQLNSKVDELITMLSAQAPVAEPEATTEQLQARIAELETENANLKGSDEKFTQLSTKMADFEQKLTQLSVVPDGQLPNPAGLVNADDYKDLV